MTEHYLKQFQGEGEQARHDGKLRDANPYTLTVERAAWDLGWDIYPTPADDPETPS